MNAESRALPYLDRSTNEAGAAIPRGLCQCGCGLSAPIARQTRRTRPNCVKGQPQRFIEGHNQRRAEIRAKHRSLHIPGHPNAGAAGGVGVHVVIAARALGHALPPGAEVHHVDRNGHNNVNRNLVICQDHAYHKLLHIRTRVVKAGGNPNTQRVCGSCHLPKDFSEFTSDKRSVDGIRRTCRPCHTIYIREWLRRRRAARLT
jgi:hypothetical protein